ncbi:MAG: YggT family protein [Chromatiaceae bacterium]|jgi:YggT family protein|nr:YggT family protein [Chromatiaceae bacterium]
MSGSYLTNPVVFLIQTLFGLYAAVVMIRFLLQWVRADFYNPVSQFVVRLTTPVLRPLRRVIPGWSGLDLAALFLAWLVKTVELALVALVLSLDRNPLGAFAWAIPQLVVLLINILLFAVLIRVILSWMNPDPYHPAARLLDALTAPLLRPAQRLLPPIGGLDLSPILVMIALVVLEMLLIPPLKLITASPF